MGRAPIRWLAGDPRRMMTGVRALSLLTVAVSLAACAARVPLHETQPALDVQWPQQTAGPKIVWVKTIARFQDAGVGKGFWERAMEFFTGAEELRIVRPYGVLFDAAERLYIADPGAGAVHCLDMGKGRYSIIRGAGDTVLRTPIGLAEDDHGLLYITDSTAGTVFLYDPSDGSLRPFLPKRLGRPTGIVFNRLNGLLYIVDTTGQRVVGVDRDGRERRRFGSPGNGAAEFNRPTDIAVDNRGQLYVTDPLNYQIKMFTQEGVAISQFGTAGEVAGTLDKPKGIAVDSEGHIYVCDALLDGIQIFDGQGRLLLSFGATGRGAGEFWMPSGIYIDQRDYIFVADTYNRRIQVFRYVPGSGKEPGGGTEKPGVSGNRAP